MRYATAAILAMFLVVVGCGEDMSSFTSAEAAMNELAEAGFEDCEDGTFPNQYQAECGEGADAVYITHYPQPEDIEDYLGTLQGVDTGAAVAHGENWTVVVYDASRGKEIASALGGSFDCYEGTNVTC